MWNAECGMGNVEWGSWNAENWIRQKVSLKGAGREAKGVERINFG
jgi:hypothetical protein